MPHDGLTLLAATSRATGLLPYALAFVLLVIGLYAIIAKKNVIKIIIGLLIVDYAVNLFLILLGYRSAPDGAVAAAPILTAGTPTDELLARTVDPLPQALILTSIVIGLGIVALVVSLAIRLHEKYGTFDITAIRKLRG